MPAAQSRDRHALLLDRVAVVGALVPDERRRLERTFAPYAAARDELLERPGRRPDHLYFVGSGVLRTYVVDADGREATTRLASRGAFLTAFLPFVNDEVSGEGVAAVTPSEVLRASRAELQALIDASATFRRFSLVIFEEAVRQTEARASRLSTMTAAERYAELLDERPDWLREVPLKLIASYLGIKPQSLSRIRAGASGK